MLVHDEKVASRSDNATERLRRTVGRSLGAVGT